MAAERDPSGEDLPRPATGVTEEGFAGEDPRVDGAPLAPPPIETPGPSVPAPTLPESDTERAEWADATRPDADVLDADDPDELLLEQEESAAAAEAREIGGPAIHDAGDPALDPVYEAGGGPQDGWEAAEEDLIANATHDEGHGNPLRDAIAPETESDLSGAVYGEPDEIPSTEVTSDPDSDADDPMAGPGLSPDRGPTGPFQDN